MTRSEKLVQMANESEIVQKYRAKTINPDAPWKTVTNVSFAYNADAEGGSDSPKWLAIPSVGPSAPSDVGIGDTIEEAFDDLLRCWEEASDGESK